MRIVVTGASGQLGAYLVEHLESAGLAVNAWSRQSAGRPLSLKSSHWTHVDITRETEVLSALEVADPDVVIHLAAISRADAVLADPAHATAVNVTATERLAAWCATHGRRIIYTSTDLVFDGTRSFNRETDTPYPILMYGRTKFAAEPSVLNTPRGLVARMSLMYGFSKAEPMGFFDRAISSMKQGVPQTFFEDEYRTPLDFGSAVAILGRLALTEETGVIHIGGPERMSRWELMNRAALALHIDRTLVKSNTQHQIKLVEPRPRDVSLDTTRLKGIYPELSEATVENVLAPFGVRKPG